MQVAGIGEGRRLCLHRKGVEWRKKQLGIVAVASNSQMKRQDLEETCKLASRVSHRCEIFGLPEPPVGGGRSHKGPVVRVYASGSTHFWEQRNPSFWSVQ